MLNALKKRLGTGTESPSGAMPQGVTAMDQGLQRKFARGVQYNMKLLIRGDRNVGKTCLFNRLQGKPFLDEYSPTQQIGVGSIEWNYRACDDVVKVEMWDVVDKGQSKRKKMHGLKTDNCEKEEYEEATLDASFIDVYKGAHGVILMLDMTKSWTWEYCQKELDRVPGHIPVLILANHADMMHHRQITSQTATFYVDNLKREVKNGQVGGAVRYTESSMRNGFGLKYIYVFFNIPFLILQRESLLKQLATNVEDLDATYTELDIFETTEQVDYDKFISSLSARRRAAAEEVAPKDTKDKHEVEKKLAQLAQNAQENSMQIPGAGLISKIMNSSPLNARKAEPPKRDVSPRAKPVLPEPTKGKINDVTEFVPEGAIESAFFAPNKPNPVKVETDKKSGGGFFSRLTGSLSSTHEAPKTPATPVAPPVTKIAPTIITKPTTRPHKDSSDSENEQCNEMVATFQEDFDSDEQVLPQHTGTLQFKTPELSSYSLTAMAADSTSPTNNIDVPALSPLQSPISPVVPDDPPQITSHDFDSWLTTKSNDVPQKSQVPIEMTHAIESEEDNSNPLVATVDPDSDESSQSLTKNNSQLSFGLTPRFEQVILEAHTPPPPIFSNVMQDSDSLSQEETKKKKKKIKNSNCSKSSKKTKKIRKEGANNVLDEFFGTAKSPPGNQEVYETLEDD